MKAIQVLQKTVHEKNMTEVRREIQTKIKAYMRRNKETETKNSNNTRKRTKCLLKCQQQQQCDFLTTHKNVARQAFNMYTTTKRLSLKEYAYIQQR